MSSHKLPILLILFNRSDTTTKLINALREIRSINIYIFIDGPRKNTNDVQLIRNVERVIESIDWECTVTKKISHTNYGCGLGPVNAIDWFFSNVEMGIILEDDCIPIPSFFMFCNTLLHKYKNNSSVFHISGNNYSNPELVASNYYFSKYAGTWGWATWRRAWKMNDWSMKEYPKFLKNKQFDKTFKTHEEKVYWKKLFDSVYINFTEYWDYQWFLTIWQNNAILIAPKYNLVTNIGFSIDATHTKSIPVWYENINTKEIENVEENTKIVINEKADEYLFKHIIHPKINILNNIYNNTVTTLSLLKHIILNKLRISKNLKNKKFIVELASLLKENIFNSTILISINETEIKYKKSAETNWLTINSIDEIVIILQDKQKGLVIEGMEFIDDYLYLFDEIARVKNIIFLYYTKDAIFNKYLRKYYHWKNELTDKDINTLFLKYNYIPTSVNNIKTLNIYSFIKENEQE